MILGAATAAYQIEGDADSFLGAAEVAVEGARTTDMGWETHPDGLRDILERVRRDDDPALLAVTENGIALDVIRAS